MNVQQKQESVSLDETFIPYEDGKDFSLDLADKETAQEILQQLHTLDDPYKEVFI